VNATVLYRCACVWLERQRTSTRVNGRCRALTRVTYALWMGPGRRQRTWTKTSFLLLKSSTAWRAANAARFPLLLRQDAKTSREQVHDQTANCVARLACIVYLNHEWNAEFEQVDSWCVCAVAAIGDGGGACFSLTFWTVWQPLAWCIIWPCIQYTAGAVTMVSAWFIHWPVRGLYGRPLPYMQQCQKFPLTTQ